MSYLEGREIQKFFPPPMLNCSRNHKTPTILEAKAS